MTAFSSLKIRHHLSWWLFLLSDFFCPSYLPSLLQKWEGWWVVEGLGLIFSYRIRCLMREIRLVVMNIACWHDSTDKSDGMGRLHLRWGPQVYPKGTLSRIPANRFWSTCGLFYFLTTKGWLFYFILFLEPG